MLEYQDTIIYFTRYSILITLLHNDKTIKSCKSLTLWMFQVVGSTLVFDVFDKLVERFHEDDVEGIIVMLKSEYNK